MTVQFSLWDRLKLLQEVTETQSSNLASLVTHLLATKALSLSVFKVRVDEYKHGFAPYPKSRTQTLSTAWPGVQSTLDSQQLLT